MARHCKLDIYSIELFTLESEMCFSEIVPLMFPLSVRAYYSYGMLPELGGISRILPIDIGIWKACMEPNGNGK